MANFKTHVTVSTLTGVCYAGAGSIAGLPLSTCMVAGGVCGVAGMLPDLDSDNGIPLRELVSFSAAVAPLLMMDRFQHLRLSHESMVLAGGLIYIVIRFGIVEIFKRYTVHRGMWHSLPAAATVGLLVFLACSCQDLSIRLFKASAGTLGFLSHLLLDELYSLEMRRGRLRIKKSFGTAFKLWGKSNWANVSTYAKLVVVAAMVAGDPYVLQWEASRGAGRIANHRHDTPDTSTGNGLTEGVPISVPNVLPVNNLPSPAPPANNDNNNDDSKFPNFPNFPSANIR